jgi:zinc transporter 1/2/3
MDWPGVIKIFAMIVMFLLIIVVGSLPIRIKSFKSNPLVLSMTKAFSGGLFLAVGLVHLLPEANEHFENYYKE